MDGDDYEPFCTVSLFEPTRTSQDREANAFERAVIDPFHSGAELKEFREITTMWDI